MRGLGINKHHLAWGDGDLHRSSTHDFGFVGLRVGIKVQGVATSHEYAGDLDIQVCVAGVGLKD